MCAFASYFQIPMYETFLKMRIKWHQYRFPVLVVDIFLCKIPPLWPTCRGIHRQLFSTIGCFDRGDQSVRCTTNNIGSLLQTHYQTTAIFRFRALRLTWFVDDKLIYVQLWLEDCVLCLTYINWCVMTSPVCSKARCYPTWTTCLSVLIIGRILTS